MTPAELIAAFDVLAEAPDGVKRLRELVLRLAVRGRLVPQDPAEEPATSLLARIVSSRRMGHAPNPATPCDQPFDVPTSWAWVTFGEIFQCRLGKMLDKAKNKGRSHPYLRNANVRWAAFDLSDVLEMRISDEELNDVSVQRGDLVICEGGEPGRAAVWEGDEGFVIQKALHRARPVFVNSHYYQLHLAIDAASGRLAELLTGATIKHLTGQSLHRHLVTLPPLAEQDRIVARVNELMALLDRLEAARNKRESLRAAARDSAWAALRGAVDSIASAVNWTRIAQSMTALVDLPVDLSALRANIKQLAVRGRLVEQRQADEPAAGLLKRIGVREFQASEDLPQGWSLCRIASLAAHIVDGTHHTPTYVEAGIPFVSAKDIDGEAINFVGARRIAEAEYAELSRRCNPKRGNVLVTKSGSIGRVAVVATDEPFTLFESVALIPLLDPLSPQYVAMVVEVEVAGAFGQARTKGAAVKHLHLKELRELLVPVPPLEEQHRIVAKVDELMALCDALEASLTTARDLQTAFAAAAVHHLDTSTPVTAPAVSRPRRPRSGGKGGDVSLRDMPAGVT
jgi:type I restriction enzyme S subunit